MNVKEPAEGYVQPLITKEPMHKLLANLIRLGGKKSHRFCCKEHRKEIVYCMAVRRSVVTLGNGLLMIEVGSKEYESACEHRIWSVDRNLSNWDSLL